MQLSDEQIQTLFSFTKRKGVHWYDLQLELVDHMACRIEEEITENSSLGFDAALDKVYKSFGLFGFAKVVQEKHKQLQRMAKKMWWKEVVSFLKWPRMSLLFLIAFVLWKLPLNMDPTFLMRGFAGVYIFISLTFMVYVLRTSKMKRKLLLLQFGRSYLSGVVFIYEFFILFTFNQFSSIEFCVYATLGIVFKLASFQLYNRVKQQAVELYPEAFA
jgi:hypothetical protein